MRQISYRSWMILLVWACFASCSDKDNETDLKNDLLKKSYGPNVIGNEIEYAYAMAVPGSKLEAAYVETSIPGGANTGFENMSYHTDASGRDIGVTVATDCITTGGKSQAVFIDTLAATLRYHYIIPEEARGKYVTFQFSCKAKNGETQRYQTQEQYISRVYMKKGIRLTAGDRCYISIKDMEAYTLEEVESRNLASDIDLVYHFKDLGASVLYNHAMLSPGTESRYLEDAEIPAGAANVSKVEKQVYTFDRHLVLGDETSTGGFSYVDDIDFETYNPGAASSFAFDFKAGLSLWVVTQDGKHRAFIQVNSVGANTMTVSMKKYDM